MEQAKAHSHLTDFKLGGNDFQLFRPEGFDHPYLIALAISYFGSAFEEKTIGFYFSQGRDNIIYVTVKVKSLGFR
ncbi:MAG: hypothetical protein ABIH50_06030, partial [bacterium]